MAREAKSAAPSDGQPSRFGERFTIIVLAAMTLVLGYVRLELLPKQASPEPLAFQWNNPMLDAKPGERVLYFPFKNPTNKSCSVVRSEGLVLRPMQGPDRISDHQGLRTKLPYLACVIHREERGAALCGGPEGETVIYALNYFGMPGDTKVRIDSIRPRWMTWGQRELVVYEVVMERYGVLGGRWTTYLAEEAPVTGLVKWSSLMPQKSEVHFREILEAAH
jgi:hypothetical protein